MKYEPVLEIQDTMFRPLGTCTLYELNSYGVHLEDFEGEEGFDRVFFGTLRFRPTFEFVLWLDEVERSFVRDTVRLDESEIASILGIGYSTVGRDKKLALEKLRSVMAA